MGKEKGGERTKRKEKRKIPGLSFQIFLSHQEFCPHPFSSLKKTNE